MILGIKDKYFWWGVVGLGVAVLLWYLTQQQIANSSGGTNTVTIPYLVPQSSTGASPTANTSLSNQPNIVGSSSNSQVPNFSNPLSTANFAEAPGTYGFMPNLIANTPSGVNNAVTYGAFKTNIPLQEIAIPQANSPTHFAGQTL